MNKLKKWFAYNKGPSVFTALFLLLGVIAGWFAYGTWDDYSLATQAYSAVASKLTNLAKQSPAPSEMNLSKLGKTIETEQASLNELLKTLHQYIIPPFASLEKAKSQDAPQLLQDALRAQVTKIKGMAVTCGATLPSGFYLALDEYENRLPTPDDVIPLAKQLTVFNWITEHLISHSGLIIAEFSKVLSTPVQTAKNDRKPLAQGTGAKTELPYENPATLKISFRCDQGSLRDILNSFSQSPYFFVIDSLQLQNTVTEPPRRDSAPQQPAQSATGLSVEGQQPTQRIPIVVGREQINVSLRIRILEFPDLQQNHFKAIK
jgi:hypothetical protein